MAIGFNSEVLENDYAPDTNKPNNLHLRVLFLNLNNLHSSGNPEATLVLVKDIIDWKSFNSWDNRYKNYINDVYFNQCLDSMGINYKVISKGKKSDYDLNKIDCIYTMNHGMY